MWIPLDAIILLFLAALALAAPAGPGDTSQPGQPVVAPVPAPPANGAPPGDPGQAGQPIRPPPVPLSPRVSVICYNTRGCVGTPLPLDFGGGGTNMKPGEVYTSTFVYNPTRDLSCRFDTRDDWRGEFAIGRFAPGLFNLLFPFSDRKNSTEWGQTCVNKYDFPWPTDMTVGITAYAKRW
ncbi:hypothetical protein Q8F55_002642 [Vanrija albida]|uniref:Ubiquitin 3 binding protein But2 C-terminal domain-containing protein n=1 Tax=Vanrija albida TaxID=181172 RepID=A0ABR3QAZ4_9TREE